MRQKVHTSQLVEFESDATLVSQRAGEPKALFGMRARLAVLALRIEHAGYIGQSASPVQRVTQLLIESRRRFQLDTGLGILAPSPGDKPQLPYDGYLVHAHSQLLGERQALSTERLCPFEVVLTDRQLCRSIQHFDLQGDCDTLTHRQCAFQEAPSLSVVPTDIPEPVQRAAQTQRQFGPHRTLFLSCTHPGSLQQPGERCPLVLMLLLELCKPAARLAPPQVRL